MTADVQRITIALNPEADANLAKLTTRTSLSKTDLVNRAVNLYEYIESQARAGHQVLIRDQDGTTTAVRFL